MDKRLFLVGLIEGDLQRKALLLQKLFAERYGLYKSSLPQLHITLEIVEEQSNLEFIQTAVMEAAGELERFPVRATGFACFPPPYKSVGLLIEKSREIERAVETLREHLAERGIESVRPFGTQFIYHLTLANTFLADNPWNEKEFLEACSIVDRVKAPLSLVGTVNEIAIWRPLKDAEEMVVSSFALSEAGAVSKLR